MTNAALPIEAQLLAAELVLGFIDGAEKLSALQRQLEDKAFAGEVERWQRLADRWLEDLPSEPLDETIWRRIDASLGGTSPGVEHAGRGSAETASWRRRALFGAAASVVLALALGLSLAQRYDSENGAFEGTAFNDNHIAQITSVNGTPLVTALYRHREGILELRVEALANDQKAPELWVIDAKGKPHSLGLLVGADRISLSPSTSLRRLLVDEATVAITLEPKDNRNHNAPSSEIIGSAKLKAI